MRLRRSARRHQTGVVAEDYWAFAPGDRVLTVEGFPGVVASVEDGPHPGSESYEVVLDNGMGGGAYSSEELRAESGTPVTAAKLPSACDDCEDEDLDAEASRTEAVGIHTAADDYPELGDILVDRPNHEHALPVPGSMSLSLTSAKHIATLDAEGQQVVGGVFRDMLDSANEALDPDYQMGGADNSVASFDWCRFRKRRRCWFPETLNAAATAEAGYAVWIPKDRGICPRDPWDEQKVCPVAEPGPNSGEAKYRHDATVPWEQGGQRRKSSLQAEAAYLWPDGVPLTDGDYLELAEAAGIDADELASANGDKMQWKKMRDRIERDVLYRMWAAGDLDMKTIPFEPSPGPDFAKVREFVKELADAGIYRPKDRAYAHLQATAKADSEFAFHFTAAWSDVRAKAKRIRSAGEVRIISTSGLHITAEVKGDNHLYETRITRTIAGKTVAMWECGCAWASYSWGRTGRWKRYEGRMCSHALALVFEAQAQEMFGGTIKEQDGKPVWRGDPTEVVRQPTNYPKPKRKARASVEARKPDFDLSQTDDYLRDLVIDELADWLVDEVKDDERFVSNIFTSIANKLMGELEGFQYRIKGKDSIVRKMKKKLDEGKLTLQELEDNPFRAVGDALRFTMTFAEPDWANSVQKTAWMLQQKGFSIVKEDNTWQRGDSYSGLHWDVISPKGTPIELQFHTSKSLKLKEEVLHKMYEEFRDTDTPLARRQELFDLMVPYWDSIPIPPNALDFPKPNKYDRPTASRRANYAGDLHEPLAVVALREGPMRAKVRGRVVTVVDFDDRSVTLDNGEVVPARQVFYPTWDPSLGLSLHDSVPHISVKAAGDRVTCKLPGCSKTTTLYSDNYDYWSFSGGGMDTFEFCSPEHQSTFEERFPDWAEITYAEVKERVRRRTGAANSTGVMVALVPPIGVAKALAELGTEPADEMHITLLYLGDSVSDEALLKKTVAEVVAYQVPLRGHIGGFGVFGQGHTGEKVIWASWDVPEIERLKVALQDALASVGIEQASEHGYTPHMTLSYGGDEVPTAVPEDLQGDFAFYDVVVAVGGEWTHIPFGQKLDIDKAAVMQTDWAPRGEFGEMADGYGGSYVIWADQAGNVRGAYPYEVWWADPSSWDMGIDPTTDPLPFVGSKEAGAAEGLEADRVRSFQGRDVPDTGDVVDVYRDLSGAPKSGYPAKESWSIKTHRSSNVVAHTQALRILNVQPDFNEGARKQYQRKVERGPHAYLQGTVDDYVASAPSGRALSYYPDLSVFFFKDNRHQFGGASAVTFWFGECIAEGGREIGNEPLPRSRFEPCWQCSAGRKEPCEHDVQSVWGLTTAAAVKDTPVEVYGLVYKQGSERIPAIAYLKEWGGWDSIPVSRMSLAVPPYATEPEIASSSVAKVVSGQEPFRDNYVAEVYVDEQGDAYMIDGNTRLAMYLSLGFDSVDARVYDARVLGAPGTAKAAGLVTTAGVTEDAIRMLREGFDRGEVHEDRVTWYAPTEAGQSLAASDLRPEAELHDEEEPALPRTTGDEDDEHLFEAAINAAVVVEALADPSPIVQEAMAEAVTESLVEAPPTPGDPRLSWLMSSQPAQRGGDDMDVAAAARAHLAKESMKTFTPAEQQAIIGEGEGVTASNLDLLEIEGTHYEALEAALAGADDEEQLWL